MKRSFYHFFIILAVSLIHLGVAYSISRFSWDKNLAFFGGLKNLHMIEVNLGVEESLTVNTPLKPKIAEPPEEFLNTTVKDVTQSNLAPKLAVPKKKPPSKEVKKAPEKIMKKHETKKDVSPTNKSSRTQQPIQQGNPNGINGSKSTYGNAKVDASLGAGYGNAMRGRCSDISDESDDVGSVKLKVTIGANGKAINVEILSSSGIKRLDNQASRMATGHTYQPAKINGNTIVGSVTFNIHFKCGAAA